MTINDFGNWLNNNQGILSVVLFILTIILAWFTGFLKWIRNEISRENRASRIICAWSLFPDKEDSEFFEYKFAPRFQNKTDEVIKDFWINFATSGFDLTLNQTPQISLFDGWNVRGDALNLTSRDTYKFAPQNFLEPFEIIIKLRKKLPEHGAWLYISYGIQNSKKIELNYRLTYKELKKFVEGGDHSGQKFLKYMGMTTNNYWKAKMFRLFSN